MPAWHAVYTQQGKELVALASLKSVGASCFFPYRLVRRWSPERRTHWARAPFFPRYLFADLDLVPRPGRLEGIEQILGAEPIPEPVMVELIARAEPDGRIVEPLFRPGERISIDMRGLVVEFIKFDNRQSAQVLVPMFGQLLPTTVPVSRILKA